MHIEDTLWFIPWEMCFKIKYIAKMSFICYIDTWTVLIFPNTPIFICTEFDSGKIKENKNVLYKIPKHMLKKKAKELRKMKNLT